MLGLDPTVPMHSLLIELEIRLVKQAPKRMHAEVSARLIPKLISW